MVSSALPSPSQFSALETNSATDALCFTLTSCLDNFAPFHPDQHALPPSAPWLSDVLREHRAKLRAAERKWHKSKTLPTLVCISHTSLPSLQMSPLLKWHTTTTKLTTVPTLAHSSKRSLLFSVLLPLLLHQLLQLMTLQRSFTNKTKNHQWPIPHTTKLIITS